MEESFIQQQQQQSLLQDFENNEIFHYFQVNNKNLIISDKNLKEHMEDIKKFIENKSLQKEKEKETEKSKIF